MFHLKLHEYMDQKAIAKKHRIQRLRKLGFTYQRALKLLQGNIVSIKMKELFILCDNLQCTPKEILRYIPSYEGELHPEHAINQWTYKPNASPAAEILKLNHPKN